MAKNYSIVPLNETSALVSFGNNIDVNFNERVLALHSNLSKDPFDGFVESVPAYSSLAVFYCRPARFERVREFLEKRLTPIITHPSAGRHMEIPVLYDGDDLDYVAKQHRLSRDQVIAFHTSVSYRVFMIGFLPGFPYMGIVDERIATPRRSTPRALVPAGSVGIAGNQTGIYPQSSPGGWQLIGRSPCKIFDASRESPSLLNAGDSVKFYSITKAEFENRNEH